MMKLLFVLTFVFNILIADDFNSFEKFEQFDQFEKQNKQEFNRLKNKVKNCINNWNFGCAKDSLYKMKKYITSKKDNKILDNLWDNLYAEEKRKERYKDAQRRANSKKYISIKLKYCDNDSCDVYINGSFKTVIEFEYKENYPPHYQIFYHYHLASYFIKTSQLYISDCGDKYNINNLQSALYYTVKCYETGSY